MGTKSGSDRSGSDAPSWRKKGGALEASEGAGKNRSDEEVTSPLKIQLPSGVENTSKCVLFVEEVGEGKGKEVEGETAVGGSNGFGGF